jgi:hypothetical protein
LSYGSIQNIEYILGIPTYRIPQKLFDTTAKGRERERERSDTKEME